MTSLCLSGIGVPVVIGPGKSAAFHELGYHGTCLSLLLGIHHCVRRFSVVNLKNY